MTLHELAVKISDEHDKEEKLAVQLKGLLYAADALLEALNGDDPDMDQMETIAGVISTALEKSYTLLEEMDETDSKIIKLLKETKTE